MIKNKFIVFAEKQVKFFPSSDKYKIIISLLALIYLLTASFSIYKYVRVKARYKTKISEYQSRLSEYQTQLSEYQKSINAWEAEFNRVYYKYKIVPDNLDIVELRSSVDEKFKYNSNLKKAKTWEELKGLLEKEFALLKPTLMQEWKITDEKLLLAGYITAKVTNLWDRKRFHSQQDRVSLNQFLNGKYADCSNHAIFLYMLLNNFGIPAKRVGDYGHVYVEAVINNKPFIFDSFQGFFADISAEDYILHKDKHLNYYLLPYYINSSNGKNHKEFGKTRFQKIIFKDGERLYPYINDEKMISYMNKNNIVMTI